MWSKKNKIQKHQKNYLMLIIRKQTKRAISVGYTKFGKSYHQKGGAKPLSTVNLEVSQVSNFKKEP